MMATLKDAGFGVPAQLASRLAELNLNSRMALVAICIALSRESDAGFESKATGRSVQTSAAYKLYCDVVLEEGTLKPVNITEFEGARDILEGTAFIKLGSSPSTSPTGKPKARKPSRAQVSDQAISLSHYGLDALAEALKEVPAADCERTMSTGAMQETLRMSKSMLFKEEQRTAGQRRKREFEKRGSGRDKMAPREGFNGDGLDKEPVVKSKKGGKSFMGGRVRVAARETEEDETIAAVEAEKEEDGA